MKACKLWSLKKAGVAQLAEQLIRNQQVGSSNLLPGSTKRLGISKCYSLGMPSFFVSKKWENLGCFASKIHPVS